MRSCLRGTKFDRRHEPASRGRPHRVWTHGERACEAVRDTDQSQALSLRHPHPEIYQLVAITHTDIVVKGSWGGLGWPHLVPHVNAPVADLPVRRIVGAHHFLADLTLPYGRVIYTSAQGFVAP